MICPRCNTGIEEYSKICPRCGLNISSINKQKKDKKKMVMIGLVVSVVVIFFLIFIQNNNILNNPLKDTEYINSSNEYNLSGYRVFIPTKYVVEANANLFAVTDYKNSFSLEISDKLSFRKLSSDVTSLTDYVSSNGYSVISATNESLNGKDYVLLKVRYNGSNLILVYTSVGRDSVGNATIVVETSDYNNTIVDVVNIFAHTVK